MSASRNILPLLITVDVCDGSYDRGDRRPRFNDLMDVLPDLKNFLFKFISSHTNHSSLPVTWFLRADEQVKREMGSVTGLFTGWKKFWDDIIASYGEVGWHPHLFFEDKGKWVPGKNGKQLEELARSAWDEIIQDKEAGWNPVTCRIGEAMCSNGLMRFLDEVGIMADSTAIPGRRRSDSDRHFDWEPTPEMPYHPSQNDYRSPAGDNETPFRILEIPFTVAEIHAPYDAPGAVVQRYLDLSYDPTEFEAGLRKLLPTAFELVTVIHPMQAAGLEIPDGGLIIGGYDVIAKNLDAIVRLSKDAGMWPAPFRMCDFAEIERIPETWG